MREYSKVSPRFWIWARQEGLSAVETLTALYLVTCPESNPLGLYYLTVPAIPHYIASPPEGVQRALLRLSERGFLELDDGSGTVWIRNMAQWQILQEGEPLKPSDNRVVWVRKEQRKLPKSPFLPMLYEKYKDLLHLEKPPIIKPSVSPSRDLRKQDHDQEQDQDHDQEQYKGQLALARGSKSKNRSQDVLAVYAHWRTHHPRAAKTLSSESKDWKLILGRLEEGRTVLDGCDAIDGLHLDDWVGRSKNLALKYVFRDDATFVKFLGFKRDGVPTGKKRSWVDDTREFIEQEIDQGEQQCQTDNPFRQLAEPKQQQQSDTSEQGTPGATLTKTGGKPSSNDA